LGCVPVRIGDAEKRDVDVVDAARDAWQRDWVEFVNKVVLPALVPLAVLVGGLLFPRYLERRRRAAFLHLIRQEIGEAGPHPRPESAAAWPQRLTKRFIHEAIFADPSQNRDFLLSLDPELAYNLGQLWITFKKADRAARKEPPGEDQQRILAEQGAEWCNFLAETCRLLDGPPWRCRLFNVGCGEKPHCDATCAEESAGATAARSPRWTPFRRRDRLYGTVFCRWACVIAGYHPGNSAKCGLASEPGQGGETFR
jgi:hypothetical protein